MSSSLLLNNCNYNSGFWTNPDEVSSGDEEMEATRGPCCCKKCRESREMSDSDSESELGNE